MPEDKRTEENECDYFYETISVCSGLAGAFEQKPTVTR